MKLILLIFAVFLLFTLFTQTSKGDTCYGIVCVSEAYTPTLEETEEEEYAEQHPEPETESESETVQAETGTGVESPSGVSVAAGIHGPLNPGSEGTSRTAQRKPPRKGSRSKGGKGSRSCRRHSQHRTRHPCRSRRAPMVKHG